MCRKCNSVSQCQKQDWVHCVYIECTYMKVIPQSDDAKETETPSEEEVCWDVNRSALLLTMYYSQSPMETRDRSTRFTVQSPKTRCIISRQIGLKTALWHSNQNMPYVTPWTQQQSSFCATHHSSLLFNRSIWRGWGYKRKIIIQVVRYWAVNMEQTQVAWVEISISEKM